LQVGGSSGHTSVAIARAFPSLKFVVQDYVKIERPFNAAVPEDLKSRITFQAHDFFTPQPVKGAAVYLLRAILHDWSDKYATKIVENIVPALKDGSHVIVIDSVVPPPGRAPPHVERMLASLDMQMMVINAKERMADEWSELFRRVDGRFKPNGFVQPLGSLFTIMDFLFDDRQLES
jgi:O-methyltransferase domain